MYMYNIYTNIRIYTYVYIKIHYFVKLKISVTVYHLSIYLLYCKCSTNSN